MPLSASPTPHPAAALPLYLASASPRRSELLTQIGLDHTVLRVPSPPGEDEPRLPDESVRAYAQRTTLDKTQRAVAWVEQQGLPRGLILCADTSVALGEELLGKPVDAADAARILRSLSGQRHEVRTWVALYDPLNARTLERESVSLVWMKPLSATEIQAYCASGEAQGKAGAYGIQGLASIFIERLDGSYSGVMGLPLHETAELLRAAGRPVLG
ncbi:Maf family protein [Kerstersia similis]|uniref:Maf family protein n=1 Tax=Kerstersia similis TaxID=206505 RepID=UPI0039EF5CCC